MRTYATILLFFVYSSASAQKVLDSVVAQLNTALMARDTVVLNRLLHKDVSYGHSNGWTETKAEVTADLCNGKLVYSKIDQQVKGIIKDGNTACVRADAVLDIVMKGAPIHIKLHVLQVWIRKNNNWQLLARQSTKMD